MNRRVHNGVWRYSSVAPCFFVLPTLPTFGSVIALFAFGPWLGYMNMALAGAIWLAISYWLYSTNRNMTFITRRFLYRIMTMNFRFRRLF